MTEPLHVMRARIAAELDAGLDALREVGLLGVSGRWISK